MTRLADDWVEIPVSAVSSDDSSLDELRCTEETDEIDETEEPEEPDETEVDPRAIEKLRNAVDAHVLVSHRTSNRQLFELARKVKGIEKDYDFRLSPTGLSDCFELWRSKNETFLDQDRNYFLEFLVKLQAVRYPWGERLLDALEAARDLPAPNAVFMINDPDAHLAANLCRELQRRAKRRPFFLTCRALGTMLGRPHETAAAWLRAFQSLNIIRLVKPGHLGHASRYKYIAKD